MPLETSGAMTKTIIITGARAPVALHLARLFHSAGHRVILADTFRFPMSRATRCKHSYVQLPPPRANFAAFAAAVDALMQRTAPDLVIPTCEEVFHLAAVRDRRGIAVPLFAPDIDALGKAHNKADFADVSKGLGADAPQTRRLECAADIAAHAAGSDQLVFKPVWSRFGARVLIKPSVRELQRVAPTAADPWIAQSYVPGVEISAYAVGRGGRLVACQVYRPTYRASGGAGVAFEPFESEAARQFAVGFVAKFNWTGQCSFDFRHDAEGQLRVIECNPRATSGVHFFAAGDGLPEAILGEGEARASVRAPMMLPMAMLAYGLPHGLRHAGFRRWWADARAAEDLTHWPGDRGMLPAQVLALAEIATRAVRGRCSLIEASVRDIAWSGGPFA